VRLASKVRPIPSRAEPDDPQAAILKAAGEILDQYGYDGLSTTAIARRARVSTGEVRITILDRYEAPNNDATLLKADPAIREVIAGLSEDGGAEAATIERVGGSRDPFAVRVLLDQPRPLIQWAEGVGTTA
jgi:hypothetical protein